jgi:hypothetical protein
VVVNDGELDSEHSIATVEIGAVQEMVINLSAGWSLISLYLQPVDTQINSVLSSIEGKYDSVWAYDAAAGLWRQHSGSIPVLNPLEEMEARTGYWIMMNHPGTLIVQGIQPASAIPLKAGWNLVGYSSQTPMSIEDYLLTVEGMCSSIWTYNSGSGEWLRYYAGAPALLNNLEYLEPGSGYWIEANEDCIWNISQ